MPSTPAMIHSPPYPLDERIDMARWSRARTPRQAREALRGPVPAEEMAMFLVGSDSPAGNAVRHALLHITDPGAPVPDGVQRLLDNLSSQSEALWAHLLSVGGQKCSDPTQAWRLFVAWSMTATGGAALEDWEYKVRVYLWDTLDTSTLNTERFEACWQLRQTVPDILSPATWILVLGALSDERLLERQREQTDGAERAKAAWTALFNSEDDVHCQRLLEQCDLMLDHLYSRFAHQIIQALACNLDNVPIDDVHDLVKHIDRLGDALDRYARLRQELPPAPLDRLAHLIVGDGTKMDTPHLNALVLRQRLDQHPLVLPAGRTQARPARF